MQETAPSIPEPSRDFLLAGATDFIRSKTFSSNWKGYDPKEVEGFVQAVAEWFDALKREVERLDAKLIEISHERPSESPTPTPNGEIEESPTRLTTRMVGLLESLDQEVKGLRDEARVEAGNLLTDARHTADGIQAEAARQASMIREEAESLLRNARRDARKAFEDVASEQAEIGSRLGDLRDQMVGVIGRLESALAHIPFTQGGDQTEAVQTIAPPAQYDPQLVYTVPDAAAEVPTEASADQSGLLVAGVDWPE